MNFEPVLTKSDYYRRWVAGEFGNKPSAWNSIDELEKSDYSGLVNIRHIIPNSSYVFFNVKKSKCRSIIRKTGISFDKFRFNEPMPDEKMLLQGELCEDHSGWRLAYCTEKTTMREAMKKASFSTGLQSKFFIRKFCDPSSQDQIEFLLDKFPDHVIEFSVYGIKVGNLKKNTIIWEVRKY